MKTGNDTKPECNCSQNGSATFGGKLIKTPFQQSGKIEDYDPSIDETLGYVCADFQHASSVEYVPIGMAMLKFATLLAALDWAVYSTREISLETARQKIKWAADLIDKKFDMDCKRLPQ